MNLDFDALLDRLQKQDECQYIEVKESTNALGKSALETISAFSNEPGGGGGYFIFGLKRAEEEEPEKRYLVKGVSNPDKVQQELANVCRNTFNIRITPKISVHTYEGRTIIVAFVPEAFCRNKPVFIERLGTERGAFRRIGSADHRCTADDLDLLYQLRSQKNYESEVLPDASWEDISLEAIEAYRRLRSQLDPNAEELTLGDRELLLSLKAAVKVSGDIIPNIGGVLLFGNKSALRREMPMAARIDYIIVEGIEWVQDPSARYQFVTEYREALVTLMPRLHAQIMSDIPNKFGLETGQLQRSDTPFIPRDVIREALANALMHRDYRLHQPTQIIRYSNRLEFRNAGYSLKPIEDLGEPGSKPRNPIISAVFHELKHAETKGTGIRSVRKWMLEAGLTTPPIIESNRESNEFDLILLPHHLLDHEMLKWLSLFKGIELSDAQRRALAFTRKVGAITNQDYRQLNGSDTLSASAGLRGLRDAELLAQKGKGSGTYYKLSSKALGATIELSGHIGNELIPDISPGHKDRTPGISPGHKARTPDISPLGLDAIPAEFPTLPENLRQQILDLSQRAPNPEELRDLIQALCSLGPLKKPQLANILNRNTEHLGKRYLSKMIKSKDLEYLFDDPAHPQQAYKTPNKK